MKQHNFLPGKINNCQICGSTKLKDVMNIGYQPLANSLAKTIESNHQIEKFPVNIIRCVECTLLQLDYIVDQKKVYHLDYPYLPGITKTVDNEQKELSDYLYNEFDLKNNNLVIDIGSNDGSLLKHFKVKGLKTIGIEPTNIAKIANQNGINTIQSFFNEETVENIIKEHGKAKVITCTNVFAHMSTLGDVMDGIVKLLDDDGYFCFENHYIMEILEKVQYDTFYHEHLRTYSLISLVKLFEMYDLNLFDAQIVTRYGGSIRCVVSKKKQKQSDRLQSLIDKEKILLVNDSLKTYDNFVSNIISSKKDLINKILELKSQNKKIIAKSCPARAVVLLNYCGLDNTHLDYIAEQPASLKLNYFVPGTGLKIISDDILKEEEPDYILLLAWHLSEPIINKWKNRGLKSKFIVPLPKVKII
jgi:2-polyprenyl-3-methyl-5-hydroxy-6-metoxy-1,4-benzoquinol methylase